MIMNNDNKFSSFKLVFPMQHTVTYFTRLMLAEHILVEHYMLSHSSVQQRSYIIPVEVPKSSAREEAAFALEVSCFAYVFSSQICWDVPM